MIKYQCTIKTDLNNIIDGKSIDAVLMERAANDIKFLDKCLYFYHTPPDSEITVWNLQGNKIHIDPGMNRFIGRSLKGIENLNARLLTDTPYVTNEFIEITGDSEIIHPQLPFPSTWKFTNTTLTMMGEQMVIEDYWGDTLPKFLSDNQIKKHTIIFKSRKFFVNNDGTDEQEHQLTHQDDFTDILKNIFSSYEI